MIDHGVCALLPIAICSAGMLKLRPMTGYEIKQATSRGLPIYADQFRADLPCLAKLGKRKNGAPGITAGRREAFAISFIGRGTSKCRNGCSPLPDQATIGRLAASASLRRAASRAWTGLLGPLRNVPKQEEQSRHRPIWEHTRKGCWTTAQEVASPAGDSGSGPGYGVLQSECRVRWAERAPGVNDKSKHRGQKTMTSTSGHQKFSGLLIVIGSIVLCLRWTHSQPKIIPALERSAARSSSQNST